MSLQLRQAPKLITPNILLYGPPKTGKTLAACSTGLETLLLNADLPNATYQAHQVYGETLAEIEYEGFDTLIDVVDAIQKDPQIGCVSLDPVGELHRRLMEEASKRAIRPGRDIYGDTAVHLERFCRKLCELPVMTVLVAHDALVKDDMTGQFEHLPFTGTSNPALGQKLMGMVDIIGFTGVMHNDDGTKEYVAQLVHQGGRRGGDRFDCLGDWQPLNLATWLDVINNRTTPEAVPA